MNRKIPFHELAALLAANCNITPEEAEEFIKNFFDLIAQTLTEGETVKIKGIGTFSPSGDATNPVDFTPDAEIADTINAPFALFEPETLSDTLSDEELSTITAPVESEEEVKAEAIEPKPEVSEPEVTETDIIKPEVTKPDVTEATNDVDTVDDDKAEAVVETTVDENITVEISEPIAERETATEPVAEQGPVAEPVIEREAEPVAVAEPVVEPAAKQESVNEQETVAETEADTKPVETQTATKPVETPTATVAENKPVAPPAVKPQVAPVKPVPTFPEEEPEEYYHEPDTHRGGPGFGWGFLIGILVGLALGACGVYLAIDYIFPTMPAQTVVTESEADDADSLEAIMAEAAALTAAEPQADTTATPAAEQTTQAAEAPAATPAPAPEQESKPEPKAVVKDTVRPGYLLNDMAKKHYGNKCFWVYIYEENKAKIANPNRVGPGLVLVIPPAEKYGINASSQSSIKAANEKAGKILTKYPR